MTGVQTCALPISDNIVNVALSGSLSLITIDNTSEALVEDGVQINQSASSLDPSVPSPVVVSADTQIIQIAQAGSINPTSLGAVKRAKVGLGFTVGGILLGSTTRALIGGSFAAPGETPRVPVGPTRIAVGDNRTRDMHGTTVVDAGLAVRATGSTWVFQLAVGGSKDTRYSFTGSGAFIDAESGPQRVEAAIQPHASRGLEIRAIPGTSGDVSVTANDATTLVPAAVNYDAQSDKAVTTIGVSTASFSASSQSESSPGTSSAASTATASARAGSAASSSTRRRAHSARGPVRASTPRVSPSKIGRAHV